MAIPGNKRLYAQVKALADAKFDSSGIYKSSWIVREYKKRGGKYIGSKPKSSGLKRWYKEKWVDLNRPIKNSAGKTIGYKECGRSSAKSKGYPLCRPSKRVSPKTPRTYKEISKNSIRKAKSQKRRVKGSKNIQFGKGRPQYFGKNSKSKKLVQVPQNVKKWALYAFKLKKLGFEGARETGWKRAKQLATQTHIPIEDLRYMRNWYARHIITSYPGFKQWLKQGRPKDRKWQRKRSIISWISWSGDAGFRWVNSQKVIKMLNSHFGTNYKQIKGKR